MEVSIDEMRQTVYSLGETLRNRSGMDEEDIKKLREFTCAIYSDAKKNGSISFERFTAIIDELYTLNCFSDDEKVNEFLIELLEECL